jgi:hydroxymethylglutaryl-CoA lyase
MPEQIVKLIECPRDAWQGLPRQIPTELKAKYLRGLIDAGFRHIDAVSFVSPKAVPQMADSEAVLEQLSLPNDIEIIGIVVNEKGAARAIGTGKVQTLGYPCSISPTFLRRNQNQSPEENQTTLRKIHERAQTNGLGIVAYISMAFGNPYQDAWSKQQLNAIVAEIAALGIRSISLADTVGVATPELIGDVVSGVVSAWPGFDIGVHMHSTRAAAGSKVLAAYDAGCRRFDAALGGLGGCPFAQDRLVGNVPTEEVIRTMENRGVKFSIRSGLQKITTLNDEISQTFSA